MNMFKPVAAKSVDEYIKLLVPQRREVILYLKDLIEKNVPELKIHFTYNMLGFGKFKYKNYKKEIIDWPIIALASQKNYVSLYVCSVVDGQYIAEKFKDKLGKVSVGKSCVRFKKLEDLDLKEVKRLIKLAAKNPGLVEKNRP
jgi:uncharacterized protein YdhG (YjbR/CyaY superfamily)